MQISFVPTVADAWRSGTSPAVLLYSTDADIGKMIGSVANVQKWHLDVAEDIIEAVITIANNPPQVVLCDLDGPADILQTFLDVTTFGPAKVPLIVSSRLADERLWAEILNRGAFDLLMKPVDPHELCRLVGFALDSVEDHRLMVGAKSLLCWRLTRLRLFHSRRTMARQSAVPIRNEVARFLRVSGSRRSWRAQILIPKPQGMTSP